MIGQRVLVAVIFCAAYMAVTIGCGGKPSMKVNVTPKLTRAVFPVDAKDANSLSAENYDKIKEGMTQDEVRAVFGTSRPEVSNYAPSEEYELVWEAKGKEVAVKFRGDKSISKSRKDSLDSDSAKPK